MGLKDRLKRQIFGAELAKLKIEREQKGPPKWKDVFDDAPKLLFNPNTITLTKKTRWSQATQNDSDTGNTSFTGGMPASFQIELFFDTYEGVEQQSLKARVGKTALGAVTGGAAFSFFEPAAVSVAQYTNRIRDLTIIDPDLGRPPLCQLSWGQFDYADSGLIFKGFLKELSQTFTLFMPDGTPVRAKLDCSFEEFVPKSDAQKQRSSTSAVDDDPVHTVRRGETLSSIAQAEYNNPQLWRPIAQANGLTNPRTLTPGQVLVIPVLRPSDLRWS